MFMFNKNNLKMKRLWLMACLTGTMATAQAQSNSERGGTPSERADKLTEAMTKNLDLTEEQRATVAEINLKYAEEVADFREETREQREAARATMKEIRQNQEAALKEVLTEEQIQKYEARRDERQDHRRRKRRDRQ
jgi:Spy/CpxP family protein refolding chaperone